MRSPPHSASSALARKRVEWTLLIMVLLVAGAILASLHVAEVNRVKAGERDRLRVLTNVVVSNVQGNLTTVNRSLEGVKQDFFSGPIQSRSIGRLSLRLRALQTAIQNIRAFLVLDSNGLVTDASEPILVGKNLSFRDYFKAAKAQPNAGTLYVSAPFQSLMTTHDRVITVSRMIPGLHGEFAGLVVATLTQAYFSDSFTPVNYASDVWGAVVCGDGVQLISFPEGTADQVNINQMGTFFNSHLRSGHMESVLGDAAFGTNEHRLMVLQTIQPTALNMDKPLVIVLSRRLDVIAEPLRRAAIIYALLYCIVAVLSGGGLYWLQRRRAYADILATDLERERLDAEDRIRLNDALRQSESRFRTLIEDAPLAIAILRGGYFVYTNPRYRKLHGYSSTDDLSHLPWSDMIAPESRAKLREQERLIIDDSPVEQIFEAQGLRKEGSEVPVFKTTARVMLVDGPATLIFAQDISAQKCAEMALLHARDAAEAASRSKAEFLANMSHEIRSPLNAILGLAYLLEQAHLDLDAQSMVRKIRASGRMLLGIINDILDVSKIEAGHVGIECALFRLDDVMNSVANTMGLALGEKDVELIIQPLPAGVTCLLGDSLRLEQILSNLTSNAIKFTQQGHVELRVSLVSQVDDNVILRFDVRDTGIGIAPELHSEMFSPFMQADSSTTRRFGGTGLGLTICRQLVTLMGGEIGVTSTLGQGSNFWFTLPLQLAAGKEFSSQEMVHIDALIADANEATLGDVTDIASGLGWQVCAVRSGEALLSQLFDRKNSKLPNVIVLDWQMPGIDGLTTTRAIRASFPDDACPIVVMANAHSFSSLSSQPGAELVDAILNKPVTASTLYNATIEAQHRRKLAADISDRATTALVQSLLGVRILIVDDSEINRDVAQRILGEQGAIVSLAVDGKAALEWLLAHPNEVDLVLMDVQMPVMDGIEATRQLRRMPQFDDLPIVALTAGAFKAQQDAARAAGMTHFISKPFDVPTTIALIQQIRRKQVHPDGDVNSDDFQISVDNTEPETSNDHSVIDIAGGLKIWGDVQTYYDYLWRFVDGYGNTVQMIQASLADGDRSAAAALAHKLVGVAGNFALLDTRRLAIEAEHALSTTKDAGFILTCLDEALQRAISTIERLAPRVLAQAVPSDSVASRAISAESQAELRLALIELLTALDSDNPAPVKPILEVLSKTVPLQALSTIRECVQEFDFRGAEADAVKLAEDYGITFKE